MPEMNAPAERGQSKADKPLDFSSKEVGRYQSVREKPQEPTNGPQTSDTTNRYAPERDPGERTQATLSNSQTVDRTKPGVSNLSEVDALKNEAKRLDNLAAEIDNKLKSPLGMDSVMADPTMRGMLRKRVESELSTENFDYLEAVERFDRNPSKEGFKAIYNNYVRDEAKSQVNFANPIRKELDEKFKNIDKLTDDEVGKGFLEKSRKSVSDTVELDSLARLKTDPAFKKYSDNKISNLKEEKIAVVAQSDTFKNQLWKHHANELNREPSHRYIPLERPASVSQDVAVENPDDGYQNVTPEENIDDGYQNVTPEENIDDRYQNVTPEDKTSNGYSVMPELAAKTNDGYGVPIPVVEKNDGYSVVPERVADKKGEYAVELDLPEDDLGAYDEGYSEVVPVAEEVNVVGAFVDKKLEIDPYTELVVDFERLSPLGDRALEILKDSPELDDKLAEDWASLRDLLEDPNTSLEDAQEKMAQMEPRVLAVINGESPENGIKRQETTLKGVTLHKKEHLASGNFGSVHKLQASNGMSLVGKSPLDALTQEQFLEEAQREAMVYVKVGPHPNIARCYGMQTVDGSPTLVLENVGGDKLESMFSNLERAYALKKINREEFVGTVQHLIKGSLQGLAQFEAMGMSHLDIKSDNIMFDNLTMQAKLVDMGVAQEFGKLDRPKGVFQPNMPPEFQLQTEKVNQATDSYGIGRMLFPLMERDSTVDKNPMMEIDPKLVDHYQFRPGGGTEKANFGQGAFTEKSYKHEIRVARAKEASAKTPEGTPQWQATKKLGETEKWTPGTYGAETDYVDFMNRLTHPDPGQRLSPLQALKHPFMTDNFGSEDQFKTVLKKITGQQNAVVPQNNVPSVYGYADTGGDSPLNIPGGYGEVED
jgi:serine/threonine protein kinase